MNSDFQTFVSCGICVYIFLIKVLKYWIHNLHKTKKLNSMMKIEQTSKQEIIAGNNKNNK